MEQLSNVLINVEADEHFLETMHFQLIATNETSLGKPATNFCSLIALKLQDFAVLGMFNYSSVASKLLKNNIFFVKIVKIILAGYIDKLGMVLL